MEKLILIKVSRKIVEEAFRYLLSYFSVIEGSKVLVHGGGRSATKLPMQLGIESKMVNGRRITDIETLKVVSMVYGKQQYFSRVTGYGCKCFRIDGSRYESDAFG